MLRFVQFVFLLLVGVVLSFGVVQAAQTNASSHVLPFEEYFAQKRADKNILKFNDFSGKIVAKRIKKLLRSGNVLGDRVLLTNNTAVYFPEGYIVSSTLRLEQWRPRPGVHPKQIYSSDDVEPNPDFSLIDKIDQHLGKVCAVVPTQTPFEKIIVRKTDDGMLSLVQRIKGRLDKVIGRPSEDVVISSALSPQYLTTDRNIQKIVSSCL